MSDNTWSSDEEWTTIAALTPTDTPKEHTDEPPGTIEENMTSNTEQPEMTNTPPEEIKVTLDIKNTSNENRNLTTERPMTETSHASVTKDTITIATDDTGCENDTSEAPTIDPSGTTDKPNRDTTEPPYNNDLTMSNINETFSTSDAHTEIENEMTETIRAPNEETCPNETSISNIYTSSEYNVQLNMKDNSQADTRESLNINTPAVTETNETLGTTADQPLSDQNETASKNSTPMEDELDQLQTTDKSTIEIHETLGTIDQPLSDQNETASKNNFLNEMNCT